MKPQIEDALGVTQEDAEILLERDRSTDTAVVAMRKRIAANYQEAEREV